MPLRRRPAHLRHDRAVESRGLYRHLWRGRQNPGQAESGRWKNRAGHASRRLGRRCQRLKRRGLDGVADKKPGAAQGTCGKASGSRKGPGKACCKACCKAGDRARHKAGGVIPICIRKENKARSRRQCCSTARRSNAVIVFNANWNNAHRTGLTRSTNPSVFLPTGWLDRSAPEAAQAAWPAPARRGPGAPQNPRRLLQQCSEAFSASEYSPAPSKD